LAELNKLDLCYPRVLARFAVAQTRAGRMLGRPLNCKDIASEYCQRAKHIVLQRLDKFDDNEGCWREAIVEDRHAGPSETARVRIDFAGWLKTLRRRDRRIAMALAGGETTGRAAQMFKLSESRVSQLRRDLKGTWDKFIGEAKPPQTTVPA
jgi:hypothetical protein